MSSRHGSDMDTWAISQFFKKQQFLGCGQSDSYYIEAMKLNRLFLLLIPVLLMGSCSEIQKKRRLRKSEKVLPFVFRMHYFLAPDEQNMSFPLWFNDSIIQKNKIQSIIHKSYGHNTEEEQTLLAERIFVFDEQGALTHVQRKRYYENFLVENVTFKLNPVNDILGHHNVEIIDSLHPKETVEYALYEKNLYTRQYAAFSNTETGDYLFYIADMKFRNAVAVDSLFQPTPRDVIVFGSPARPVKKFNVTNIVNETNVVNYEYFKNSAGLKSVIKDNYPFYTSSTVTMDKKGNCTGYIDSTFSAERYLNRTVSTFEFGKHHLPVKLKHSGMRKGHYELFEYHYYD